MTLEDIVASCLPRQYQDDARGFSSEDWPWGEDPWSLPCKDLQEEELHDIVRPGESSGSGHMAAQDRPSLLPLPGRDAPMLPLQGGAAPATLPPEDWDLAFRRELTSPQSPPASCHTWQASSRRSGHGAVQDRPSLLLLPRGRSGDSPLLPDGGAPATLPPSDWDLAFRCELTSPQSPPASGDTWQASTRPVDKWQHSEALANDLRIPMADTSLFESDLSWEAVLGDRPPQALLQAPPTPSLSAPPTPRCQWCGETAAQGVAPSTPPPPSPPARPSLSQQPGHVVAGGGAPLLPAPLLPATAAHEAWGRKRKSPKRRPPMAFPSFKDALASDLAPLGRFVPPTNLEIQRFLEVELFKGSRDVVDPLSSLQLLAFLTAAGGGGGGGGGRPRGLLVSEEHGTENMRLLVTVAGSAFWSCKDLFQLPELRRVGDHGQDRAGYYLLRLRRHSDGVHFNWQMAAGRPVYRWQMTGTPKSFERRGGEARLWLEKQLFSYKGSGANVPGWTMAKYQIRSSCRLGPRVQQLMEELVVCKVEFKKGHADRILRGRADAASL